MSNFSPSYYTPWRRNDNSTVTGPLIRAPSSFHQFFVEGERRRAVFILFPESHVFNIPHALFSPQKSHLFDSWLAFCRLSSLAEYCTGTVRPTYVGTVRICSRIFRWFFSTPLQNCMKIFETPLLAGVLYPWYSVALCSTLGYCRQPSPLIYSSMLFTTLWEAVCGEYHVIDPASYTVWESILYNWQDQSYSIVWTCIFHANTSTVQVLRQTSILRLSRIWCTPRWFFCERQALLPFAINPRISAAVLHPSFQKRHHRVKARLRRNALTSSTSTTVRKSVWLHASAGWPQLLRTEIKVYVISAVGTSKCRSEIVPRFSHFVYGCQIKTIKVYHCAVFDLLRKASFLRTVCAEVSSELFSTFWVSVRGRRVWTTFLLL